MGGVVVREPRADPTCVILLLFFIAFVAFYCFNLRCCISFDTQRKQKKALILGTNCF